MKRMNKHHWGAEIWPPQIHFLFWLLAHETVRVEFWFGKRNSVIWLPLKGSNRGEDAVKELNAKKWDDAEVWRGKWVSSSRVCTLEDAFGGPTAQGG